MAVAEGREQHRGQVMIERVWGEAHANFQRYPLLG